MELTQRRGIDAALPRTRDGADGAGASGGERGHSHGHAEGWRRSDAHVRRAARRCDARAFGGQARGDRAAAPSVSDRVGRLVLGRGHHRLRQRSASLGDCRGGSDTVCATRVFIEPAQATPTAETPEIHQASARVSYRQETTPVALTLTGDRRAATVTVEDELLRGADVRCLSVNSTGRYTYDPRQPDGGPAIEQPLGGYFAGFSPRARLKRALKRCAAQYPTRRETRNRAACKRRARERLAVAI
jgi:hypothetical protein